MQGILIDPEKQAVTAVEVDNDYRAIQRMIGVDLFTTVELNDARDVVYVDDEGLLKDPEWFFTLKGYGQPLAGKGLVLGTDAEGETQAPTLTVEAVQAMVGWKRLAVKRFDSFEGETNHPVFGKTWVVGSRPVFEARPEKVDEAGGDKKDGD